MDMNVDNMKLFSGIRFQYIENSLFFVKNERGYYSAKTLNVYRELDSSKDKDIYKRITLWNIIKKKYGCLNFLFDEVGEYYYTIIDEKTWIELNKDISFLVQIINYLGIIVPSNHITGALRAIQPVLSLCISGFIDVKNPFIVRQFRVVLGRCWNNYYSFTVDSHLSNETKTNMLNILTDALS